MTNFVKDLLERAAKTFVQTFAAVFVIPAVADIYNSSAWEKAGVAAGAAAIAATASVLTSVLSKNVGPDAGSASTVV